MPEKNIDLLFTELLVLKRDIEDTLLAVHRIMDESEYNLDIEAVKVHRMKLTSMGKMVNGLHGSINHYLSLGQLRIAYDRAYTQFQLAIHAETGE